MARGSAVRSQMPSMKVKTAVAGRNCAAPFDQPHDTGNGGIPTHTYESLGEKRATTTSASFSDASGGNNRTPGAGNRRFPFGGKMGRRGGR